MPEWNAAAYHQLSGPQLSWARTVAARLVPRDGERILDVGCGTGRMTTELAAQHPRTWFVGVDISQAMLREARHQQPRLPYARGDGAMLPFVAGAFDAVFSTATFHWIADHARLFEGIHAVLAPGGRLVAQCGGGPNLTRLLDRAHALMDGARFHASFVGWRDPWYFASAEATRAALTAAGFSDINVSLVPAPTTLPNREAFADFISCVCVRHHVDRLPPGDRTVFVGALADGAREDDPPFTLDYWRLNVAARKRAAR